MKKPVLIILGAVVLLVFAVLIVATKKGRQVQTNHAHVVAVELVNPARNTLKRVVEVFGSLSPKTATEVKSEQPGRILKVQVKEWDRVNPDDVLLELDPTDFKLVVNKDEAGLKMARAQLLQAKVDLDRARRELNRAQKLKDGGLVTGQELDERRTAMESAAARVALAEAQVGQSESQLAESRHNLAKTIVRAPIRGTVYQRKVDIGDWVDKGTPLFSIVDNRVLDFTANVPAVDLARVREGQLLTFLVDGLPNRVFEGKIKRINPMVNNSDRSGRVQAEVENGDEVLKGGVYARGQVLVAEYSGVLTLPKACLIGWDMDKETARIFLVDDTATARSRSVTTGLVSDDLVEVRSGVNVSDRVVVRGGFNLREGDKVRETSPGEARS
ncbi:MAG TPA: efflux RND transporter periplasmic adaptor subunit [Syntrophobacter fumaroxidans]|nr:efflux RND transporter periplasmic adaptor subunit [Syntrophobacter fumaroxidans]